MNKINLKNKLYFLIITIINSLFIIGLVYNFVNWTNAVSNNLIISRVIIIGIFVCIALCTSVLLFINKNEVKFKDFKVLFLFLLFVLIILIVSISSVKNITFVFDEILKCFIFNYYLMILFLPGVLLNAYSILMSVEKK